MYAEECFDKIIDEYKTRIEELESENSELRARLDKAIEFACKVGDTVYCIHGMSDPEIKEWKVNEIRITDHNYILSLGQNCTKNYRSELSQYFGTWWFTERNAAESRLAELKGEQK